MTVKCIKCGKVWQVSIKANVERYICPHCTQKKEPIGCNREGLKEKTRIKTQGNYTTRRKKWIPKHRY